MKCFILENAFYYGKSTLSIFNACVLCASSRNWQLNNTPCLILTNTAHWTFPIRVGCLNCYLDKNFDLLKLTLINNESDGITANDKFLSKN